MLDFWLKLRLNLHLRRETTLVYEVVGNGVDGEASKRMDLQLADDIAAMGDDGVDGNE